MHPDGTKDDSPRKLLVVQVAGIGHDLLERTHGTQWHGLNFRPLAPVFPALTCTAQASFRTASQPSQHGIIANGYFDRELRKTLFWEQASTLVSGPRIWQKFQASGRTVAMLFWQQSLGESADVILSPAPIHRHHGGIIDECYSKPAGLYQRLCDSIGRPFHLRHYWGPMASTASSRWIAETTAAIMRFPDLAPDLCLTYLPALDYDLQRHGTTHPRSERALAALFGDLDILHTAAKERGYGILVFGDYAIEDASRGAILPNSALIATGHLTVRRVGKRTYPDFYTSRAFAMVDHQITHIYVNDTADTAEVADVIRRLPGVDKVLDRRDPASGHINHPRSGDLVAIASPGYWFAYPWWQSSANAPDYAAHVDIHRKPGYDPCELFSGWPPWTVSTDHTRIRGTHGRTGAGSDTCWASDVIRNEPRSVLELSCAVRQYLDSRL